MIYATIAKYAGGIILGLGLAWTVYAGIIRPVTKPNPSTTQAAESISNYNYYNQPRVSFGCAHWELTPATNSVK